MTSKSIIFVATIVILSFVQSGTGLPQKENNPTAAASGGDVCNLPLKEGNDDCMEHKPMFYYNAKENKCVKFHYKGCEGNDNRFNKLVDCQAKCVK